MYSQTNENKKSVSPTKPYKKGNKNNNIYIKVYRLKRETDLEAIEPKDIEPEDPIDLKKKKRLTRLKQIKQT